MRRLSTAALLFALATPLVAQEHQHPDPARTPDPGRSPYAEMTSREIKALSPEDIARYRAGEGMGFALPAELNRYPGPRHALELADSLNLSAEQRRSLTAARDAMRDAAIPLGERIIEKERELDRAFAGRTITERRLRELTFEIGRLQGELRAVHLAAHLATTRVLSAEQAARYEHLRGYAAGGAEHRH